MEYNMGFDLYGVKPKIKKGSEVEGAIGEEKEIAAEC
jgi:hypothetical protein